MTVPIIPLAPEECAPLPDAGMGALRTERGNLPLESVDVTADIAGLIAGVTVVQGFRNPFDVPLEATYVFPLPDRAAVTAFRMEAGDRVIEGVLKERAQARADYDRALAEGRRAAIAEEERPDVFTIRVGNISPGESVRVRLTLSQPLPYEDGAAVFRFPLVVAPRYIPGSPLDDASGDGVAPDTDAVPDASRISPPVLLPGFPNPVRLSLAVNVDPAGLDLREMRSSLHEVTAEGTSVRLRPGERLDRDFILRLVMGASTSLVLVPDGETSREGTFSLTVVPPDGEIARQPRDVVLLLDRSGSMGGWKMVAARRAAARIVDTLTTADRFAVLSFDHLVQTPELLPDGLVAADDRNRYRAVEHLSRLEARGGTEMLAPLERALALLGESGRERVLVLVTDGQVGNEDQILERAGTALSGVRVHTVGIDRAVNAGFLGRLAALGGGRCELVESEDRLDEAMEHIHRRIGAPLVTDLSLKGEGIDPVDETVTRLGSLFSGVPLTVLGRYRAAGSGDAAVTVRGLGADGRPWERRVVGTVVDNPAVRAIWARAHLRRLEDRYACGERALESTIVDTSLRYGVLCRFTAFVAVDSRVTAEGGPEHHVIQPVEMPSGWDMPTPLAAAPASYSASVMSANLPTGAAESFTGGPVFGGMASDTPIARAAGTAMPGLWPTPTPPVAPGGAAPRRARPFARPAHPMQEVRSQLADELARLRAAESLPVPERRRHLSDLGSRLAAMAAYLGGHRELSELAERLQTAERPETDVWELWRYAVEVLTALTSGRTGGLGPEQPGGGGEVPPAGPDRDPDERAIPGVPRAPEDPGAVPPGGAVPGMPPAPPGRRRTNRPFWKRS